MVELVICSAVPVEVNAATETTQSLSLDTERVESNLKNLPSNFFIDASVSEVDMNNRQMLSRIKLADPISYSRIPAATIS